MDQTPLDRVIEYGINKSSKFESTEAEMSEAWQHHLQYMKEEQEHRQEVQKILAKEGKIILLDSSFYISECHHLCQRCVDIASIEIDGIDGRDYPDFSDAFVSAASWDDGTPLNEDELNELQDQHSDLIYSIISDRAIGA